MSLFTALFIVAAGLFAIAGGVFDWDWFMDNRRAWIFVRVFGRQGARVFYVLLGLAILGIGAVALVRGR